MEQEARDFENSYSKQCLSDLCKMGIIEKK
jgi:hypothetical protein